MVEQIVDPAIYNRHYYLTDNEGCHEYEKGLDQFVHPKFRRAFELADLKPGEKVLDIGCGRGEIVYYAAQKGCEALGLDYSEAAVEIAKETIRQLPPPDQLRAKAVLGEVAEYPFEQKFDVIFLIEIYEHLYDWQIERLSETFKRILSDNGRVIIMTPNVLYEKYLRPTKRILDVPFNFFKWPWRILRGKYKPKSIGELFAKIFRVRSSRGELEEKMHVNVSTVANIKRSFRDFDVRIWCEDHSLHPLSLLLAKWFGRDIVAIICRP